MISDRENIEWVVPPGCEGMYEVSNYGDVHQLEHEHNGRFYGEKWIQREDMKIANSGYVLSPCMHRKEYGFNHRLVAIAFGIPRKDYQTEINHKDGSKTNNFVGTAANHYCDGNLEWCNRKENMAHASTHDLINRDSEKRKIACRVNALKSYEISRRAVYILGTSGTILWEFPSTKEAGAAIGCHPAVISNIARGSNYHKSINGYQCVYVDNYDPSHDYTLRRKEQSRAFIPVQQLTPDGVLVAEYPTIQAACRATGFTGDDYISQCCTGRRKQYKGFIWRSVKKD